MLIGSKFYWSFVTGDVVKSSEEPVAVDSKLGLGLSILVKWMSAMLVWLLVELLLIRGLMRKCVGQFAA